MRAWHADTKRMVAHMRLEPLYPDVWDVACSPTEPTIACASSAPHSHSVHLAHLCRLLCIIVVQKQPHWVLVVRDMSGRTTLLPFSSGSCLHECVMSSSSRAI